jgi:hypothetical protein
MATFDTPEQAILDASCGNIGHWEDYGSVTHDLDASAFLADLRSIGWDVVRKSD